MCVGDLIKSSSVTTPPIMKQIFKNVRVDRITAANKMV